MNQRYERTYFNIHNKNNMPIKENEITNKNKFNITFAHKNPKSFINTSNFIKQIDLNFKDCTRKNTDEFKNEVNFVDKLSEISKSNENHPKKNINLTSNNRNSLNLNNQIIDLNKNPIDVTSDLNSPYTKCHGNELNKNFNSRNDNLCDVDDEEEIIVKSNIINRESCKNTYKFFQNLNENQDNKNFKDFIHQNKNKSFIKFISEPNIEVAMVQKIELNQAEKEELFSLFQRHKTCQMFLEGKLNELNMTVFALENEKILYLNSKMEYQKMLKQLHSEINFSNRKVQRKTKFSLQENVIVNSENLEILQGVQKNKESNSSLEINNSRLNFPTNVIISKKDKEEIENLRNLVKCLQNQIKEKDADYMIRIENLKGKIEISNEKINELKSEIKELKLKNQALKSVNELSNNINASFKSRKIYDKKPILEKETINKIENIENKMLNSKIVFNYNFDDEHNQKDLSIKINQNKSDSFNSVNNSKIHLDQLSKSSMGFSKFNTDITNGKKVNFRDSKNLITNEINDLKSSSCYDGNRVEKLSPRKSPNKSFRSDIRKSGEKLQIGKRAVDDGVYDMIFNEKYHPKLLKIINPLTEEKFSDGKIIKFYENDKREIIFPNGVRKEIHSDGYFIVYFNNQDIKQVYPNGKVVYLFEENKAVRTSFTDGLEVYKYKNGQIEKKYPDDTIKIIFPNGEEKTLKEYEIENLLTK